VRRNQVATQQPSDLQSNTLQLKRGQRINRCWSTARSADGRAAHNLDDGRASNRQSLDKMHSAVSDVFLTLPTLIARVLILRTAFHATRAIVVDRLSGRVCVGLRGREGKEQQMARTHIDHAELKGNQACQHDTGWTTELAHNENLSYSSLLLKTRPNYTTSYKCSQHRRNIKSFLRFFAGLFFAEKAGIRLGRITDGISPLGIPNATLCPCCLK
jgi:hypothetical protein